MAKVLHIPEAEVAKASRRPAHLTADRYAAAVAAHSGVTKDLVKTTIGVIKRHAITELKAKGMVSLLDIATLKKVTVPAKRATWIMVMGRPYQTKKKPARTIVKAEPGTRFSA